MLAVFIIINLINIFRHTVNQKINNRLLEIIQYKKYKISR